MSRCLSDEGIILKEIAEVHNLNLSRVKDYKKAVIIMQLIEIKLNKVLHKLLN